MPKMKYESGYQDLGNAVVALAAYDYYNALKSQQKFPGSLENYYRVKNLENFFNSDWCCLLSSIDTDAIVSFCRKRIKVKT